MRHYLFCFLIFCSFGNIKAQTISSPESILGYEIGTQFSRHHQVVDYFKTVATEAPEWIKLEQYGSTYERRPLYLAYISSPENMEKLEQLRENQLRFSGIKEGTAEMNGIAIVWLSYAL